jgi:hypothetical protein
VDGERVAGVAGRDEVDLVRRIPRRRTLAWGIGDVWVEGVVRHRRRRTEALGFRGLAAGWNRRYRGWGTVLVFAQALTQHA